MEREINKEINLGEIILMVRELYAFLISKYKIILIVSFLGAALGLAYAYKKKTLYVANLTFALEDEKQGGIGGALGLAGQLGLDVGGGGGGAFTGGNLIELFKSRSMVEKTLLTTSTAQNKNISLAELYIETNKWREDWKDSPKLKKIVFSPNVDRSSFTREKDSILEAIYLNLSGKDLVVTQKDKKTSIITIEVKSTDEAFSKCFTESLASVVSDFYIKSKSKKARINMTILQKQLDSIRGELYSSISGVAISNDKTFNLNPALNVMRVPSVRKQVDVQANTAILTELVKQTELAKVTLRKDMPLIQIIDKPIYPLKKEKLGKLKAMAIGGFLAGFVVILFLVLRRLFKAQEIQ